MGRIIYDRDAMRKRGIKIPNATMLRWEKEGIWPARIYLSAHCVAWFADEIDRHLEMLAAARSAGTSRSTLGDASRNKAAENVVFNEAAAAKINSRIDVPIDQLSSVGETKLLPDYSTSETVNARNVAPETYVRSESLEGHESQSS